MRDGRGKGEREGGEEGKWYGKVGIKTMRKRGACNDFSFACEYFLFVYYFV